MATGLRERKRLAMMQRTQDAALDLCDEHGYGHVSIEQVAERAEVSASSIYRHFGSKEAILLWNRDWEGDLYTTLRRDESLLSELSRVARDTLVGGSTEAEERHRRRLRYLLDEPPLTALMGGQLIAATDLVAEVLAGQTGREHSDVQIQVNAGALVGAMLGALRSWRAANYATPLDAVLDEVFEAIERGLPLLTHP
ncbi:TetR/AcrR family transcriptional regulator [Nocardia speluncae]|uniref:TetR/AcrR family transcriptional regulator n=1 Tax=Nocardia speluncae TaxID=419477 RepID=A0A846XIP6_9NOCA|nr:TetR/AcrR family transcriptional regulator [Nocardia speluncae]NKY34463.1 TetR/AcrR family transcriptional regulator [Nocardia speluncae]